MIDVAQRLQEKFDAWWLEVQAQGSEKINVDRAFDIWLGNRIEPEDAYQVLIYNDE